MRRPSLFDYDPNGEETKKLLVASNKQVKRLAEKLNLEYSTVNNLLEAGWVYTENFKGEHYWHIPTYLEVDRERTAEENRRN